jgi:hypothetical protein
MKKKEEVFLEISVDENWFSFLFLFLPRDYDDDESKKKKKEGKKLFMLMQEM